MKFWFDNILVNSWLPEGESGNWFIRKTVVGGGRLKWLRTGGNEYDDNLAPDTIYTGLFRKLPDGTEQRVMFDEPREIKEALAFVNKAKGKILVTGLGIGMVAVWLANKKEVTQVDVIENSQDVINLVAPHLPSKKINVIHADAFTFIPTEQYDSAWHDCFYIVPEKEKELTQRLPIEKQEIWRPGVLSQPIPRRHFLRGALVGMAALFAGLTIIPRKALAAGITFIQEAGGANGTYGITTTAGSSVIVRIAASTTGSVSGGSGDAWVKDISQLGLTSVGIGEVSIWHSHNQTGAAVNFFPSSVGRGSFAAIEIVEYSGLANANAESVNSNSDAGNTTVTTNCVTPTSTNSLILAIAAWAANDYSTGPTNSFNRRTSRSSTGIFQETADQIESSGGARNTGYSLTAGIAWASAIAAFGAAAPTGPTNAQRGAGFWMP